MGKRWIRTREGPDLPGTQETQGPITQVQARIPLARGTGHPQAHSSQNNRQAAPSMVIPLFCWRVLCQKQRHEVDRDNVCQLQPWASGHSLPASALASRHLSARERAGPGQHRWASLRAPPPQLWPGFPAKKRPRYIPKLLLSQISCWVERVHTHTCRCSSNPPNRRLPVASKPQFSPWRRCSLDLWWGVRRKGRYERVVGTGNLASYPSSAPSKLGDLEQVIKLSDAIPPLLNGVLGISLVVQ